MKRKNEKTTSKKTKSLYSLFSNYQFIYSNMWEYDKSLIRYGIVEIIFSVMMPLASVIAPAVVIRLLERGVKVPEFIQTIALVFLLFSMIAAVHSFLVVRNSNQYIDVRCRRFTHFLYSKCLRMDYHLYEEEKVREDLEKAEDAIYTNMQGVEGFMHHNVKLATNILGLITYSTIISFVNPIILVLLISVC